MTKKYTPGPWRMVIDTSPDADWAQKWPIIVSEATGDEIVGTEGFYSDFNTDVANAMLTSCAPELLEMLEDVLFRINESEEWWMDVPTRGGFDAVGIKSLIAKAKGDM